ncbi:MAG: signal peptidase I [Firmicutes bacterium]|nr:signal peptidase I [Bacillota bacterium]MDD7602169.1 signal peptidase I [Bacillota bacterium]MDY5857344.1 signal peptidase I [Anaerovoracaceae bacterium]
MKNILEWVKEIVIAVIIAAVILTFIKPIVVRQSSMEPTFYSGDYVFISKQAYKLFGEPERGDVIVFHTEMKDENDHDKNLIKRIIGLPGDTVEIIGGYVYLNGQILDEPYLNEQGISGEMEKITVPEGRLFVMGDNRGVSQDSRDVLIGCIEEDSILGRVFVRLYPFNRIRTF